MQPTTVQVAVAGLIASVFCALALLVYGRILLRLRREPGKVRASYFTFPDLLVAIVLTTFLVAVLVKTIAESGTGDVPAISVDDVVPGSAITLVIAMGVLGFLKYRGGRLTDVLGLDQISAPRASGWALLLNLSAWPYIGLAALISARALGENAVPQPLVQLFRAQAETADYWSLTQIFLAAVIIAPLGEELLFRGYLFGVGKRYCGALASGLVTALLFAAIHGSLTSLLQLFVLAVCLTLAYERTGSILVPIGMHALFNFTSLTALYLHATGVLK